MNLLRTWAVAACTLALSAAAMAQPIVIHHIGPFTGVLAGSNQETVDGARLYLEQFNAKGGVQGRPVTLETLDDGQDPKRSQALLAELIAAKKVLALFAPRTTPSLEAMMPDAIKHGVPIIAPQPGASFVNQPPKRELFAVRASYQKEAERAIQQQHSIGARKFGLLVASDSYGEDTMVGIQRAMTALKITPVATARIDNRKPDVVPAVKQMLAAQPEVMLMVVSAKAAADFIRSYRAERGFATFITLSNTSSQDYVKALGDQSRGAIVMQVMPSPFSATTQVARDFVAAATAKSMPVSYAALQGWLSAKVLTKGLERAGKAPTSSALIQGLEALGELDLGGYIVKYGPGERTGSVFVEPTIITAEGRFMR